MTTSCGVLHQIQRVKTRGNRATGTALSAHSHELHVLVCIYEVACFTSWYRCSTRWALRLLGVRVLEGSAGAVN